jgi:hypothetical protein
VRLLILAFTQSLINPSFLKVTKTKNDIFFVEGGIRQSYVRPHANKRTSRKTNRRPKAVRETRANPTDVAFGGFRFRFAQSSP